MHCQRSIVVMIMSGQSSCCHDASSLGSLLGVPRQDRHESPQPQQDFGSGALPCAVVTCACILPMQWERKCSSSCMQRCQRILPERSRALRWTSQVDQLAVCSCACARSCCGSVGVIRPDQVLARRVATLRARSSTPMATSHCPRLSVHFSGLIPLRHCSIPSP